MLTSIGFEFEGQPHCGMDDARNIARVLIRMISDHAFLRINEKFVQDSLQDYSPESTPPAYKSRLRCVAPVFRKEAEVWHGAQKKKFQRSQEKEQQLLL